MSAYQLKPASPPCHLCPTDQLSDGAARHVAASPDAEPGALGSGYGSSCRRVDGELGSMRRCKGAEWRRWFSAAVGCIHCAVGLSAARVWTATRFRGGCRLAPRDRTSVVAGKGVSVRDDPGGARIIKKKKQNKKTK